MSNGTHSLSMARPIRHFVRYRVRRGWHRAAIAGRYYLCPRRNKRAVFVITQPRSGSTLLNDLMNSAPGVSAIGEVLSPSLPCGIVPRGPTAKKRALRHVRFSLNSLPGSVSTAKFLMGQMRLHEVEMDDLKNEFPEAKYVILYRASILEQYVSYQVAKLTKKWVGYASTPKFDGKIRVNLDDLKAFCRRHKQAFGRVLSHTWLRECAALLTYEELVDDPQRAFDDKLLPLLSLSACTVNTVMQKQITQPMSEVVENYDELVAEPGATLNLAYSFPE